MEKKIDVKKLSGQTSPKDIRFTYVKRCNDEKVREFTIIGYKNKYNNKYVFLLNIKNLQFMPLFNVVGLLVEFALFIFCRNFMVITYTILIVVNILAYIVSINDNGIIRLHGAEHMMINSYEAYEKIIDMEKIKKQSIISHRCGTISFVMQLILYIIMILTNLPIPINFICAMLFKITFLRKILSPVQKILVKEPNDEQLQLAKYTFDLLIEVMEKGFETEKEIYPYILDYTAKCNE